ncbi:MAG: histidine kinase dimerization/phosphoacceptor domain -containing protein [Scytonema sp. PMC 1069.18]|nr:histidine kinase dimerization/phosphoacceptor domain -containing protein [Scytonema sp. PMC 1069.18]MEC4882045.1 histidine kinase dimerization/phosphoacceptor domain -containing protein [Scytonema sp. PMC 1070.18]
MESSRICATEHTQRYYNSSEWKIQRPDGSSMPVCEYAAALAMTEQRVVRDVEMGVEKPDGDICWLSVTASPIPLEDYGVAIAYVDITKRKQAQDRLKASLREKEVLLAEIHHRVKNNLYVVSSLLELQMDWVNDPHAKAALEDSCNRVSSMALAHENLYRTHDFAEIDFGEYVQQLAADLLATYKPGSSHMVRLNFDGDSIFLSLDQAIPCGLLLNELITNALKHGFPDGFSGHLYIRMTQLADHKVEIAVGNDGNRLPPDFDLQHSSSMGLRLVMMFVEQLMGKLELERGDITWFKVDFRQKYTKISQSG